MKLLLSIVMKKITLSALSLAILLATFLVAVPTSHAVNVFNGQKDPAVTGTDVVTNNKSGSSDFPTLMRQIISTVLVILGMLAVIMIIIGGIRYTTSNGDSSRIQGAKNTILYAVVGLVIAILAYAIVNFFISVFSKK